VGRRPVYLEEAARGAAHSPSHQRRSSEQRFATEQVSRRGSGGGEGGRGVKRDACELSIEYEAQRLILVNALAVRRGEREGGALLRCDEATVAEKLSGGNGGGRGVGEMLQEELSSSGMKIRLTLQLPETFLCLPYLLSRRGWSEGDREKGGRCKGRRESGWGEEGDGHLRPAVSASGSSDGEQRQTFIRTKTNTMTVARGGQMSGGGEGGEERRRASWQRGTMGALLALVVVIVELEVTLGGSKGDLEIEGSLVLALVLWRQRKQRRGERGGQRDNCERVSFSEEQLQRRGDRNRGGGLALRIWDNPEAPGSSRGIEDDINVCGGKEIIVRQETPTREGEREREEGRTSEGRRETFRAKGNVWGESEGRLEVDARGRGAGWVLAGNVRVLRALWSEEFHVCQDRGQQLAAKVLVVLGTAAAGRGRGGGGSAWLTVGVLELFDLIHQLRDAQTEEIPKQRGGLISLETHLVVQVREVVFLWGD
jgi:hypothetical protein